MISAMAASMAGPEVHVIINDADEEEGAPVEVPVSTPPVAAALPPVLSGRAQMEQERLARQRAREASGPSSKEGMSASSALQVKRETPPSRIATMTDIVSRDINAASSSSASGSKSRVTNGTTSRSRPSTHHPLQSAGPFPTDAAGEYYLDGELRHVALTIGNKTEAPTFSPRQVVGAVSPNLHPFRLLQP